MAPALFTPLDLGSVTVPNRIAVSPMCQYSADDGSATDWHLQHLSTMAMSGAGLVVLEATAVERRGRITHDCLGLYSDHNERALKRALDVARAVALPGTRFGIQLAHAGRKGSAHVPWKGGGPLGGDEDPWTTCSASERAFTDGWHTPEALDEGGIARIRAAFVDAALRAERLGLDVIELHMAHGYLLHQFFSPLSNMRTDGYGGDLDGRMRLLLEIARDVRAAVPDVAVGARINGSDWLEDGASTDDAVVLARLLKEEGLAYCCVTSGGVVTRAPIKVEPGYQVPFARSVREGSRISTRAVGMIVTPQQANELIETQAADSVALARAILDDPRWGWHAATSLGAELSLPPQYRRASADLWPGHAWRMHPGSD